MTDHNESRTLSPSASVVEGNTKLVPWLMLSCLISGVSLALAVAALVMAIMFSEKVEVLQLYQADFKAAMLLHGINPHPHNPGESP